LVLFAAAFAWRDSTALKACNGLAVVVALSLVVLRSPAGRLRLASLTDHALGGVYVGYQVGVGLGAIVLGDIRWDRLAADRWYSRPLAVTRGVAIALPLLVVFGALFMSADAAFENLVRQLLNWDLYE